jgi:thiosulfate dehydrogenase
MVGLILGAVLLVAGVYVYFVGGFAPVATSAQAMPFEKKMANAALHARLEKEMPKTVPIQADEAAYSSGAEVYRSQCAVCHGLPGQERTAIAKGEFPRPPQLFFGKGVTDDEPGETYWKVANGIRLTGMPGFKGSLSETQMWQVSLLLAHADKLPSDVKQALAAPLTQSLGETVAKPLPPGQAQAPGGAQKGQGGAEAQKK